MRIDVKEGVVLGQINDQFFDVCETAYAVFLRRGAVATITSGCEGNHMAGSLHYRHLAWDLRSRTVQDPEAVAKEMASILNKYGHNYDVIYFNDPKGPRIHIEYQPKSGG